MTPEAVRVFRFADADAYVRTHDTSEAEYIRLSNSPFQAELTHLELGAFRIRLACFNPQQEGSDPTRTNAIVRASYKPDRATLRMPVGEMTGCVHNGREFKAGDLLLVAPGAEIHAVFRRHQDWVALDVRTADFEALLDLAGLPPLRRGALRTLSLAPGKDSAALPAALTAAAALAGATPEAVGTPGFVPSIIDSVQDLLLRVLRAQGAEELDPPRQTRDMLRLVEAADEYLRQHVARPIYTDELCSALAVCARKLHNAFVSTYGVSPHAYLKYRRLALAHRMIRAGEPSIRLIKSVALSHGFWHMGRFAHDYFGLFGEKPSQTLEATSSR